MELIPGEIYAMNNGHTWLFKFTGLDGKRVKVSAYIVDYTFVENGSNNLYFFNAHVTKITTSEQKAHLQACIAAGKYVEPPKIESYDIF